jgi:hypothetical protein
MRALITKVFPDGSTRSDSIRVTKQYHTFAALYRYAIHPALQAWDGRAKVKVYYSQNIFGRPDKVYSYNWHIRKYDLTPTNGSHLGETNV